MKLGYSQMLRVARDLEARVYGQQVQTNVDDSLPKMVEDRNPEQDMVDITGHVVHEKASYDKDVMEIKLADTVVSSDYGSNFVKDVCIDDGHHQISEGKIVDEKSSLNFDSLLIYANSDPRQGRKNDTKKIAHELKPEIILPVGFAPDSNSEKQNSSCEEYDLEGRSTATNLVGDISEKKISLEELLRLESAEESQQKGAISTKRSENHMPPPLHGEAAGQVSINDCHGVEANTSKTSNLDNTSIQMKGKADGCSATSSAERHAGSAFGARGQNQVNHYNPLVGDGCLEDTCKPKCSTSATADAASTVPICTFEKTNTSSGKGFNQVETAETRAADPSSTSSDIQSTEKSDDQNESLASKATTDASDETALTSSPSANIEDPSSADRENHVHDFNQSDEENCIDTVNNDTVGSTQAEKDNVGEQVVPDSTKVTSPAGNGYLFEPDLFGPSIMSATVSNSGHIAYSGNISIRSDSSTTSARSFAFPVLQKEWSISSPVRMAKGERRRIRRRRSWRKGLLCCQF